MVSAWPPISHRFGLIYVDQVWNGRSRRACTDYVVMVSHRQPEGESS